MATSRRSICWLTAGWSPESLEYSSISVCCCEGLALSDPDTRYLAHIGIRIGRGRRPGLVAC
jgi:hypothetical protein